MKLGNSLEKNNLIYIDEELKSAFSSCDVANRYLIDKDYDFELTEKEQDIDIQAIEEIPKKILNKDLSEHIVDLNNLSSKLLQAIKQLDRKIREER